jgi:hypothetical protein
VGSADDGVQELTSYDFRKHVSFTGELIFTLQPAGAWQQLRVAARLQLHTRHLTKKTVEPLA